MKYKVLFDGFWMPRVLFSSFEDAEAYRLKNHNACEYASWTVEVPDAEDEVKTDDYLSNLRD